MALKHFVGMSHPIVSVVNQTSGPATTTPSSATPILPAGVLDLSGVFFDLRSEEGLFCYTQHDESRVVGDVTYEPWYNQGYYIVVQNPPHIFTLLSAICTMMQYGHEDQDLSDEDRVAALLHKRLQLQCGDQILVTEDILDSLGIPYREGHFVTGETPNNFDDGHVVIEVYIGGKWILIDMAADCYYVNDDGSPLGMYDIVQAGVLNCTQARLAKAEFGVGGRRDPLPVSPGVQSVRFNVRPHIDITINTDALYYEWSRRVWQIPGITDPSDHLTYFYLPEGLESREEYLLGLSDSYRLMVESAWLAKFPQT